MQTMNIGETSTTMRTTNYLDPAIPLQGASHADVVKYVVEIPMRYAECFAEMNDGSKASFKVPRKFLGWSSHDEKRSLLFHNEDTRILIEVDPENPNCCDAPGKIRDIKLESATAETEKTEKAANGVSALRKFIGIDGSLLILPN